MTLDQLSLTDLKLGLTDLFDDHAADLAATHSGALYEPRLRDQLKALRALPEPLLGGKPVAEQLRATDVTHDGYGGAVHQLVDAYLRAPSTSPALREKLTQVRATYVPELNALKASYPDEVSAAQEHRKHLKKHEALLRSVALAEGLTLHDWVSRFLDAGDELGALLRSRSDLTPEARRGVAALRSETVGLLNRFRAALADEHPGAPKKLAALDCTLFGYFDTLEANRSGNAASPAVVTEPAPAAPPVEKPVA